MLKEAARECPNAQNFNTAYNTIQKAVREWKQLTDNEDRYYGINVRFYNLMPESVPQRPQIHLQPLAQPLHPDRANLQRNQGVT